MTEYKETFVYLYQTCGDCGSLVVDPSAHTNFHNSIDGQRQTRKPIPIDVRRAVIERDGQVCSYCGKTLGPRMSFHLDHVVPWSHGGDSSIGNLVVACTSCNTRKNDQIGYRDECGHLRFDSYSACRRCRKEASRVDPAKPLRAISHPRAS